MDGPCRGPTDLRKPFDLFVHERQGIGLGILIQNLGNIKRPVTYFSKQLDMVTRGWPVSLRAMAATCDLPQEAGKFSLGQHTSVHSPPCVSPLLEPKGEYQLGKYQAIL